MTMSSQRGEFKIVLLGEGRVGKTSIISRFVNDSFNEDERSTTQATMFSVKAVPIDGPGRSRNIDATTSSPTGPSLSCSPNTAPQQRFVKLAIWDTAGQERFHALAPMYYRNATGAVLVYDVCDADSLRRVQTWVRELRTVTGSRIRLVVCGNKCDRPVNEHEVTPEEGLAVAQEVGAAHFFTSARTGVQVAEAFSAMAAAVYEDALATGTAASGAGSGGGRRGGSALSAGAATNGYNGATTSANSTRRAGMTSMSQGSAEDPSGRRRRRRGMVTERSDDGDLFMDYDEEEYGTDYGRASAAGFTRTGRAVTLAEVSRPGETGGNATRDTIGVGGGCC